MYINHSEYNQFIYMSTRLYLDLNIFSLELKGLIENSSYEHETDTVYKEFLKKINLTTVSMINQTQSSFYIPLTKNNSHLLTKDKHIIIISTVILTILIATLIVINLINYTKKCFAQKKQFHLDRIVRLTT